MAGKESRVRPRGVAGPWEGWERAQDPSGWCLDGVRHSGGRRVLLSRGAMGLRGACFLGGCGPAAAAAGLAPPSSLPGGRAWLWAAPEDVPGCCGAVCRRARQQWCAQGGLCHRAGQRPRAGTRGAGEVGERGQGPLGGAAWCLGDLSAVPQGSGKVMPWGRGIWLPRGLSLGVLALASSTDGLTPPFALPGGRARC